MRAEYTTSFAGLSSTGSSGVIAADYDFNANSYADIAAVNADSGTGKLFAAEETGGPWSQFDKQSLVTVGGDNALRFTWPDRTGATGVQPDAARCADYYIMRRMPFSGTVTECWAEVDIAFSSNWTSKAPSAWGCGSNPDYKMWFLDTTSSRFSVKNDYAGLGTRWDCTAPGEGDGDNNFIHDVFHDGARHILRMHVKLNSGNNDGLQRVWFDGSMVHEHTGLTTTSQTAITDMLLGANINQGPDHVQTLDWFRARMWLTNPGWD